MTKKLAFIAVTLSLLLAACAPPLSQGDILATAQILQALTALAETEAAPSATTTPAGPSPTAEPPTAEPPAPTETPAGPEVVFLAAGSFSADEESQLRIRVIEPFIHYYRDLSGHPALLTLTIQKESGISGYPYSAQAVFETGINAGWLISASGGGTVDWWLPECMVACTFSDAFRAAYPEIVTAVGG
jgi:hypothetical protein